jgi:hypothetical protein
MFNHIFFLLFVSLLLLGCQKTVEPTPTPTSTLYGNVEVFNPDSESLNNDNSGATVQLENTNYQTLTDHSGNWNLVDVLTGPYNFSITKPGYSYVKEPKINIGATTHPINMGYFILYKKPLQYVKSISSPISNQNHYTIDGTLSSMPPAYWSLAVYTYAGYDSIADSLRQNALTIQVSYLNGSDTFEATFYNDTFNFLGVTAGKKIYFVSYTIAYVDVESSECDIPSNIVSITIQ